MNFIYNCKFLIMCYGLKIEIGLGLSGNCPGDSFVIEQLELLSLVIHCDCPHFQILWKVPELNKQKLKPYTHYKQVCST